MLVALAGATGISALYTLDGHSGHQDFLAKVSREATSHGDRVARLSFDDATVHNIGLIHMDKGFKALK